MAIPVVLMIITVCVVLVTAVFTSGLSTLFYANVDRDSKQSLYAAEAGIAQAIRQIITGTAAWNGFTDVAYGESSAFTVQVFKGPAGGGGLPTIPVGYAYLLSTGTTRGKYPRKVGVIIATAQPGVATDYHYVVAANQDLNLQTGGEIKGALKSGGNANISGSVKMRPQKGVGGLFAGGSIDLANSVKWDDSQDLRAGGTITTSMKLQKKDPANFIFPNDTSPEAQPFIADGRFTNTLNSGEVGVVLPNPDPTKLLGLVSDGAGGYQKDLVTGRYIIDPARTDVVQNSNTTITSPLDLGGKIHFFPNGVSIEAKLKGKGTIVTGEGNSIDVGKGGGTVNLLALSWPKGPVQGDITISDKTSIQGLLLAHGSIKTRDKFSLKGAMIAYSGGIVDVKGHDKISYDGSGLKLPGFESWLNPSGGAPPGPGTATGIPPGPVEVVSWQRL